MLTIISVSAVAVASTLNARFVMKIDTINRLKRTNGGGGGKAPPPPAPAAAPAPPPPAEDSGPDPAMQAEIEKQRALRFKAGQLGSEDTTGTGTTMAEPTPQKTLLGA